MNDYSNCDRAVVTGLIEVLMAGIKHGKLAESDALLAALRVLRPRFRELDTFDVWLLMKRKRYIEATQVLRNLHGSSADMQNLPICTALQAMCLYASGDDAWRISANEVLTRNDDPEAVAMVNLLFGKAPDAEPEAAPAPPPVAADLAPAYYLRA
ncbi:HrpB1 family type III secretion system apparatus protein [Massilia pinisoli]|uniref:HrpB1 family type III secretion system apparatus protein n=1 Tax=Massilia pinisoli TaxID=1772194 RepID=A0ABT1ZPN7_9BURK|nr:HrpB1 family type III secretion system apparatus protein [Massilia pinisoli]MCS0581879.1 HrpB1 family type III secretion system apparatus protein [Massilia pinisoli]